MEYGDGVQDTPPSKMLLWYMDCFELKTLEKEQIQEGQSDVLFLSRSRR